MWEKADASHRAAVVASDIPIDPMVALPMLREFAARERPSNPAKPCLGEPWYNSGGPYERLKVHIKKNTYGWIAPYVKGVPEKWPVNCGYMQAYETVAGEGDEAPAEARGFVVVVTENAGGATAVPDTWPSRFPTYAAKFGSDFAASLTKPTGKKDPAGNPLQVWQDYVAGTDPTDVP